MTGHPVPSATNPPGRNDQNTFTSKGGWLLRWISRAWLIHKKNMSPTGTGVPKERTPLLGPYSRTIPRVLWWSCGGGAVSYERGTPVARSLTQTSTKGPMWGYPRLVLGALGSFLEPFCGHVLPKVDKICSKLTFEIPPRRALRV